MSVQFNNLFAELTADGQTATYTLPGGVHDISVFLQEAASDGGGTLKAQCSPDGGTTWLDVPSASWTSGDGHLADIVVFGDAIRFDLAGATTPSGMIVQIAGVRRNQPSAKTANLTADETGTSFPIEYLADDGQLTIFMYGTWGSGTMTLQLSFDGGTTWYDAAAGNTADSIDLVTAPISPGALWRVNLSGATTPDLNYKIVY